MFNRTKKPSKTLVCPDAQAYGEAIRNVAIAATGATVLVVTGVVLAVKAVKNAEDTED